MTDHPTAAPGREDTELPWHVYDRIHIGSAKGHIASAESEEWAKRIVELANRADAAKIAALKENIALGTELLSKRTASLDAAKAEIAGLEMHIEALNQKLRSLAPHGSCGCSYDKPGDVCLHHSPALVAAEAEAKTLELVLLATVNLLKNCEVFVKSRERIKKPEGDELFDNGVALAKAALAARKVHPDPFPNLLGESKRGDKDLT